jgi:hypothetical protein
MVKAKKGKNKKAPPGGGGTNNATTTTTIGTNSQTSTSTTPSNSTIGTSISSSSPLNYSNNGNNEISTSTTPNMLMSETQYSAIFSTSKMVQPSNHSVKTNAIVNASTTSHNNNNNNNNNKGSGMNRTSTGEDLDDLNWLRECEIRKSSAGESLLQLEYQEEDELMIILYRFVQESSANSEIIDCIYQIWQQTVLSTLLQSSAIWKKDIVSQRDQKNMKDTIKIARYKIHFIIHHCIGQILISNMTKWMTIRDRVLDMCYTTLQLIPRLIESCQFHPTDIRLAIIHFECKEFLANVACETWDTLYDYSIPIDIHRFVPVLRRCAMLDVLDKDWNMLGGWDDILKGIEAKCCHHNQNGSTTTIIPRLPSDAILHETTTILRNARNSMQCKFFSIRFMKYNDEQAPQRYKYFPKCSTPACSNIETIHQIHPYRCTKCWYFHYCSSSCQEYCNNIIGLHNKFCSDTPKAKAISCQKETYQYFGWNFNTHTVLNDGNDPNHDNDDDDDDDNAYISLSKLSITKPVITCHSCGVSEENVLQNISSSPTKMSPSSIQQQSSSTTSTTWNHHQQQHHHHQSLSKMKRCIQCQKVCYCSRQCQEWDWKIGGHRDLCMSITTGTTATTTNIMNNCNNNNNINATTATIVATNAISSLTPVNDLN